MTISIHVPRGIAAILYTKGGVTGTRTFRLMAPKEDSEMELRRIAKSTLLSEDPDVYILKTTLLEDDS